MDQTIWIIRALGHGSNLRPFRNDLGERDHQRLIEIEALLERGEKPASADFPSDIFGAPDATEKDYRLPDLFKAYGYWVVFYLGARRSNSGVIIVAEIMKRPRSSASTEAMNKMEISTLPGFTKYPASHQGTSGNGGSVMVGLVAT